MFVGHDSAIEFSLSKVQLGDEQVSKLLQLFIQSQQKRSKDHC